MIGNIFLTIALLAGIFSTLMYYLTNKGYVNTLNKARYGYHLMSIMVIASSILLLHAILTHQFQYKYIYDYSSNDLPLGLLMSTFYAGQEGSFLLWSLFSVIIGIVLMDYTSRRGDLEQRTMMIYALINTLLLVMISPLLKSPFNYIWLEPTYMDLKSLNPDLLNLQFIGNYIFQDQAGEKQFFLLSGDSYAALTAAGVSIRDFIIQGRGLNPLLQNFWMQIHPPLLFVGFAMAAVPYTFAVGALIKNEYNEWVNQSLPWVLFGHMMLGLAIMLGGYWAYGVLGWGGYWGWDPVENSSLVPWLIGVASIHTLLVQKRTQEQNQGNGRFVKTNLVLSIFTFLLVVYSTFLTRSGVLSDSSVHSFVAPGRIVFLFLLINVVLFTVIGIGLIIYRWRYLNATFNFEENILSRELALFTGSAVIIGSAIIIIFGTSLPIFGKGVDISFYNKSHLPIAIILGVLMGLSLLLKWKTTTKGELLNSAKFSLIATFIVALTIIIIGEVYNFMSALFTVTSVFPLVVNLEFMSKVIKSKKYYIGAYVAHIGIAIFMLGVIASGGFTVKQQVDLKQNEPQNVLGYNFTFTGYDGIENNTKYAFNVKIAKDDNEMLARPVMYISTFDGSFMRDPYIINKLTKDIYIEPLGYEEGTQAVSGDAITIQKGETKTFGQSNITFTGFNFPTDAMQSMNEGKQFQIGTLFAIVTNNETETAEALMISKNGSREFIPAIVEKADLRIELISLDAKGNVIVKFSNLSKPNQDVFKAVPVLAVEVSIKPFINLVWLGTILMVIGFAIAGYRRTKDSKVNE